MGDGEKTVSTMHYAVSSKNRNQKLEKPRSFAVAQDDRIGDGKTEILRYRSG
jgi:hypothetical protein